MHTATPFPPRAIAVFAKVPLPGAVKTRLIPAIGADAAAQVQRRLIETTLAKAYALGEVDVHLWLTGDMTRYAPPRAQPWTLQHGADQVRMLKQQMAQEMALPATYVRPNGHSWC